MAAGNPRATATACAASLPYIDEGTVGHEDYQLYYANGAARQRADEAVRIDAAGVCNGHTRRAR